MPIYEWQVRAGPARAETHERTAVNNLRNLALWIIITLLLVALFNMFQGTGTHQNTSAINYTAVQPGCDQGTVKDVTIQGDQITGHSTSGQAFHDLRRTIRNSSRACCRQNVTDHCEAGG